MPSGGEVRPGGGNQAGLSPSVLLPRLGILTGDWRFLSGQYAEAGEKYAQAVAIKPDYHQAFYNLALDELGQYAEAGEKLVFHQAPRRWQSSRMSTKRFITGEWRLIATRSTSPPPRQTDLA